MSEIVEALESGIYEGICDACPWKNKELGGLVCARTAQITVIDMSLTAGASVSEFDFGEVADDFGAVARECAISVLELALSSSENESFEPSRTYNRLDIVRAIRRTKN